MTPTSTEFLGSYPPSPPCLVLTPESTLPPSVNFHDILPGRLHTQSGFKVCHLCPPSRTRPFKGKAALQQHLSSSVHAQVSTSLPVLDDLSFHCPYTLLDDASQTRPLKQFSTVSGLVQHLESGACNGGKKTLRRVVEKRIVIYQACQVLLHGYHVRLARVVSILTCYFYGYHTAIFRQKFISTALTHYSCLFCLYCSKHRTLGRNKAGTGSDNHILLGNQRASVISKYTSAKRIMIDKSQSLLL
ncbi:hypothetical protein WAI453_009231 [Rhynchosporium graminicola]